MSRSNYTQIENPSQRWFQWSGSTGTLSYYDKEKKENIDVPLPFTFLFLDSLHTVKGFDDNTKLGIYSNEVKDLSKQVLTVKKGKDVLEHGLYKDIKDSIKAGGGKYAQSTYIAYKDANGKLQVGNIMFTGSSLAGGEHKLSKSEVVAVDGWMTFSSKNMGAINKGAVIMTKDERILTKGASKYFAPKFAIVPVSEATDNEAKELDKELAIYLASYFERTQSAVPEVHQEMPNLNGSGSASEQKYEETIAKNKAAVEIHAPVDDVNSGVFTQDDTELPF